MAPTERPDSYIPPLLHRSAHLSTILPNRLRKIPYTPSRHLIIPTPDDDFLEADFCDIGSNDLLILLHGLEGSSASQYMRSMMAHGQALGMNVLALNFRGCGGQPNCQVHSYHSGKSDDPDFVVRSFGSTYQNVYVMGFSLGGNVALKLAGEWGSAPPPMVRAVVGISVPCDLKASAKRLSQWDNAIYLHRFLNQLKRKARVKAAQFPELRANSKAVSTASNFESFDEYFTAPVHGFKSAHHYYESCSSKNFIPKITLPTLIINAENDPFLASTCFPRNEVIGMQHISLVTPRYGGHVGFAQDLRMKSMFWHEQQVIHFLSTVRASRT